MAALQAWVERTAFPPFSWVYAAAYRFARWLAVDRLRVTRGVVAVYQAGSVAEEPVWGRSDIDLVVIVDDADPTVPPRVVELLRLLHTWLPMIESPERAGVFTLATLQASFDRSPFLQWRLGPRRARSLLWGRDALASVELTATPVELARAELGWWWRQVWERWVERRGDADGYVFHKLVVGAWRAIHHARTGEIVERRDDVLALPDLAEALPPALLACARARVPIGPADAWAALHRMTLALAGPQDDPVPALAEDPPVNDALWPRGCRLVREGPDMRPDAPGDARSRLIEADGPGPHALRGLDIAGARLVFLRDGVRWPVPPSGPPEWASACPERFGRPPLDPDALRRAREALLAELRQAAADGSVFGLGGPELVGFAQAAGDLLRGERLVFLDGVDVDDPPPDLPLAQHQRVTREVAAALGVTWPEPVPQRVSVIIITRDRAPLLRRALAALRDQRRAPDEVVVVDNGSSDDTPEVIREAAAWLPIVHVFEPIAGIPRARNAGAGAATGDLLCYTDDDATADPGWLAAIEDRFQRDPRIGLVGGETLPDDRQTGIIARFFREYMGSEVAP